MEFQPKKIRTTHLKEFKDAGRKFSCLASYDHLTAGIFDEAGIDLLLVGDSAADNFLGYSSTLPINVDEMISFGRAVATGAKRSLVVVDMPFGSYESSSSEAVANAVKIMKQTGASAVKLEGGRNRVEQIMAIVDAGIPVMGHVGFTPQSVNAIGGYKIQGRGESADELIDDSVAVQDAGAFAVVLEMVPAPIAKKITEKLSIPTIGIGAGNGTDGQILVWTDMAGLSGGKPKRFVKQFANLRNVLMEAAASYRREVEGSQFPDSETSFEN